MTTITIPRATGLRSHGPDYWTILAGARTTDGTPILYHATPDSFRLDAAPPVVTVAAGSAKNRTEEPIPIPSHVVPLLRPWLKKKRKGVPVWPGRWAELRHFGDWFQVDLKRAGVATKDAAGRKATPHGLRRRYIVGVIRAGAKIHEVRRLARHADVKTTLEYYTDETMADLGAIADRL